MELMVNGQEPVAVTPFESFTWTLKAPATVGVPVIAPVELSRVKPAGRVPTTKKVNGAVPPTTFMPGLLKGTPTSPDPMAEHKSDGAATIVIGQVVLAAFP